MKKSMNDLLLLKYLGNEASENEIVQVLDWLDADPKNQRYLDELDFICNINILTKPAVQQSGKRIRVVWKSVVKWSSAAAAAVLLCFGLSYWFAGEMVERNSRNNMTTIATPPGQRMSITLSDGTLVWLNSGTKLEYPSVFPKKSRRVKVSGEAMFDVEHDAARPFIVETFACEAEVLGTKFNIISEPETSYFSAALFEGKLKVSNMNSENETIILSPDEMVEFVNGRLSLNKISGRNDYLWTEGLLNLNNLNFAEVMGKIEKYYGVKIVIATKNIPAMKYQGKIRVSGGVDYALKVLQMTSDFYYEKDDETNTIYIK